MFVSAPLAAQAPVVPQLPPLARPDSQPPALDTIVGIKPLPAFFHSLIIPGWGQSKLDRKLTAALFVTWEGVTLGMTLKAAGEVRYLRRIGADSVRIVGKKSERQDWLVLMAFNHLFSALEAYVSSHLQNFPSDVKLQAAPRGIGAQASVSFRIP